MCTQCCLIIDCRILKRIIYGRLHALTSHDEDTKLAEFILETENRRRQETRHKTENSSNVNPVCDEFPISIYPSNFPGQTDEKV